MTPSNLKEAIDWILRVTGQDGQDSGSQEAIKALAGEVKNLLRDVAKSDAKLGPEIENVKKALNGSGNDSITKLAEGLAKFIGYSGQDGKIGTGGIAVSNLPIERLRDAVLMFIAPFLGVLRYTHPDLKTQAKYTTPIGEAVEACKNGVGCGKEGFDAALDTVETAPGQVSVNLSNGIKEVLEKVKKVSSLKKQSSVKEFANKVKDYFTNVLQQVESNGKVKSAGNGLNTKVKELNTKLGTLVDKVGEQTDTYPINVGQSNVGNQTGLKTHIDEIYKAGSGALTQLRGAFPDLSKQPAAYALSAAAYNGVNLFVTVLQTDYTSYYKGATWNQVSGDGNHKTCAKIFLACLPLIFNGLSYLYWKCSDTKGWNDMTLGSPEPKAFMNIMTDKSRLFNSNKSATDVVSQAFKGFTEFSKCTSSATSYADFLKKFRGNCLTTWQGSSSAATDDTFLSGLYLCSTSYFSHQHQKKAATARPPSSIREMLYWLMGLTATPQFGDLLGHIHNVVGNNFSVAVSGSSKTGETLSADQVTSYILSTCYTCPSVLNIIQGSVAPKESQNEPWLHDLYTNAAFPFQYPSSGATLFYALSDYTYALQFQLSFLYKQCEYSYDNGCGWFYCRYGNNVQVSNVKSHLCTQKDDDCSSSSPLQAFLIDKLNGLCRKHPGTSSHLAECSGSTCHVPMGFKSDNLRTENKLGGHIVISLKPFCGSSTTPLRQLCGTLACLSKRAPRSLGDLFGFYWQVTGQLFNKLKTQDGKPTLDNTITTLFQKLPTVKSGLLYESITANVKGIGHHFFGLSWHCHKKTGWQTVKRSGANGYCNDHQTSKKACDIMSLYDSECTQNSATCGKYLEPLGISSGATFADNYAFNYLSWAVYLTDELYESLQGFLETLNAHPCKNCTHDCSNGHSGSNCKCPSVVDCADVLPLLYSNGFSFKDAFSLKQQYKKQCSAFANQLQSVISGNPLSNLLTSIDDFLFLFRYYFLSNLSTFWTIYIGLILYTFFFLHDTLHLRSHLKLTSSHSVPPLALLTSGTHLPMTKLTYIGQ
ncbi:variant erythrocyte surface antigen-1 family protein [Babesia caballi]|uniref:Variant erythrocyte surface antigen-1 family protein n=1 Tax=Babesia caballi TaxID=5871 RepID=A0AAV4LRR9_BABCB|nr:variant erythrocyte surface antigen-1 family protein [Babesia caballi]